jgi:NTP pyrophosphatase (non-canonical NTP hydrolase)
MKISEFQDLISDLYLDRDMERGINNTFLHLIEEIGELSESLRHYLAGKDSSDLSIKNLNNVGEEIADVVAWISSLANLLEIDLEKAVLEKYPDKCIKCGSKPCQCPKSD